MHRGAVIQPILTNWRRIRDPVVRYCLLFLTVFCLWWLAYEATGERARVEAAYRDWYNDELHKNDTKTTKINYVGPIGVCSQLEKEDCDAVLNGTAKQSSEIPNDSNPHQAVNPVGWAHLHAGRLLAFPIVWWTTLALGIVLLRQVVSKAFPAPVDGYPVALAVGALLRQGFLLVWCILVGMIWALVFLR